MLLIGMVYISIRHACVITSKKLTNIIERMTGICLAVPNNFILSLSQGTRLLSGSLLENYACNLWHVKQIYRQRIRRAFPLSMFFLSPVQSFPTLWWWMRDAQGSHGLIVFFSIRPVCLLYHLLSVGLDEYFFT